MKHIGIEICYSASGGERFEKAEQNAARFIAQKLAARNWGTDRVKKHQDFADKYCPHRTLDMGWKRFLDMVQAELDALATGFVDVPAEAWYADSVKWAVANGITNGIDTDHFGPEMVCTRGQAVTFLWRAMGKPQGVFVYTPFDDVPPGAYYADAVAWAYSEGIAAGVDGRHFAPDDPCTRGQIVTFMWRAAGKPKASIPNPFMDVPGDSYYLNAVLWAVQEGITTGIDTEHFAPNDECSRAQMVTFLHRMSLAA